MISAPYRKIIFILSSKHAFSYYKKNVFLFRYFKHKLADFSIEKYQVLSYVFNSNSWPTHILGRYIAYGRHYRNERSPDPTKTIKIIRFYYKNFATETIGIHIYVHINIDRIEIWLGFFLW